MEPKLENLSPNTRWLIDLLENDKEVQELLIRKRKEYLEKEGAK